MLPFIIALYVVPLSRVITILFQTNKNFLFNVNHIFGYWEHLVSFIRNYLISIYLIGGAIWYIYKGIQFGERGDFIYSGIAIFLVAVTSVWIVIRRKSYLELLNFVELFPLIQPSEFFKYFVCMSGIFRQKLPDKPSKEINLSNLDFRNGTIPRFIGFKKIFIGLINTIWVTRMVLLAGKSSDDGKLKDIASAFAVIWGTRICELAGASLVINDKNLLSEHSVKIFVFTHGSFIDFAIVPLLFAQLKIQHGLPIFLLAKDHFRDNPIFYRLLGIGRVAERLGMIFVDRKVNNGRSSKKRTTRQAVEALLINSSALAIFPQGGRGHKCVGAKNERRESAYYTVGTVDRIRKEGSHLKKGSAFIATDAAIEIAASDSRDNVEIIPVAISGASVVCPRGTMKIISGMELKMQVGDPIVINPASVSNLEKDSANYREFVGRINSQIDCSLKHLAKVHARLEQRFFEDIRSMLNSKEIEEISIAMKSWRGNDYLMYAILDAIYCCEPKWWRQLLGEFTHLIFNFATRYEFLQFKGKILFFNANVRR